MGVDLAVLWQWVVYGEFITSLAVVGTMQEVELLFQVVDLELLSVEVELFFVVLVLHVGIEVDVIG